MPPLPPVANVIRITLKHFLSEDADVVNHQFFNFSGTSDDASMLSLATAAGSAWDSNVMPHLGVNLQHVNTLTEDLSASTAPVGEHASTTTGGITTGDLGAGCSVVIQKHVRRRYRGGHPRQYLAGIPQSALSDDQRLSPSFLAAITSAYEAYVAAITAHTFGAISMGAEVNVSYFQGFTNHTFPSGRVRPIPNPRPGGPITDAIVSYLTNPKLCSQRRRNLQSS